jgi:hypothetical protein
MLSLTSSWKRVAALTASAFALQAAPGGWVFEGKTQEYESSLDAAAPYNGQPALCIKSKSGAKPTSFASMRQPEAFSAAPYAGKRIRLTANLKSEDVQGWGGLWMRIDDAHRPRNGFATSLALDDMHNGLKDRSIKGTTGWQNYSVVLDVPPEATGIYIGFLLTGTGTLWMNGYKLEIVGSDIPVTARPLPPPPLDLFPKLSFEK